MVQEEKGRSCASGSHGHKNDGDGGNDSFGKMEAGRPVQVSGDNKDNY